MAKKVTLDNLAGMIKCGFDDMGGRIVGVEKKVDGFEKSLKKELAILSEINTREHEEIKLRLDNVAYRFELVELQKRVDKLEKSVFSKK
jgi:hypothetical protein